MNRITETVIYLYTNVEAQKGQMYKSRSAPQDFPLDLCKSTSTHDCFEKIILASRCGSYELGF